MIMINRGHLLAFFASAPLLGACPIDGDIGDTGDGANDGVEDAGDDEGEGEGEAGDDKGEGEAGDDEGGETCAEAGGECLSQAGDPGFPALCEDELGRVTLDADCGAINLACCGDPIDDGGEPCDTEEECGPAPGAPNYVCPDGVTVAGPGPCQTVAGGGCGYPIVECPNCCDPTASPSCFEGATCCADGSWACNDGGGGSTCESGEGTTCACCDPAAADELGCIEGASCCADGSWACNDGGGGSTCESAGTECAGR